MADGNGKKGIGIIGYGGFGEFIRNAWDQMDSAHVVAVCDSNPTRAPIGDVHFYQEVGPLLADPDVDIVSIATPPNSHKDLALIALQAGKHVLVEKPLAITRRDGELIKQAAKETARVASVDFVLRYNPITETLHKIIDMEILGKLRRIDLRNYAMLDQVPEGHWFWNPEISGRILVEHGVHFFDLARWMTGAPAKEVWGLAVERKPGIEDRMFAAVKYENGTVGTFWHSFSRPRALETTTFHFAFDLGEIDMFGWIPLELKIWGWTGNAGLKALRSLNSDIEIYDRKMEPMKAESSEFFYDVEHDFRAAVKLDKPKMQVYAENLRSIMADLISTIDQPGHIMRVTLDDAIEAVKTAELATNFAHPESKGVSPIMQPDSLRPESG